MFAGDDGDSVISYDVGTAASARWQADQSSTRAAVQNLVSTEADRLASLKRISRTEAEFGWSGSAGGIRGRDDRQIQRDAEFEKLMEERRRKRKERKKKDAGFTEGTAAVITESPPSSPYNTVSSRSYRPVFAPTHNALATVERTTSAEGDTPRSVQRKGVTLVDRPPMERSKSLGNSAAPAGNDAGGLKRGKSLKDKVGAALGRWGSRRGGQQATSGRTRAATTGGMGTVGEVGAVEEGAERQQPQESGGLTGLARKLSRKLVDPALEERKKRELVYVEPPKLSHVMVGDKSPFPPRAPLNKGVVGQSPPSFDSVVRNGSGGYAREAYEKPQQHVVV